MFSNLSALNENSKGRLYDVTPDHRLPYERDRDRIYHSTAFRKLKDKTQVFMFEKGDYYRNRLTHTLEVSQIARSVSRKFQLNEDLAECISLCHDLGHSPFGHVGEDIITQELDHNFNHNIQSFRQVTLLEKKYVSYDGLNLSWETLDGLIKHNGPIQDPIHEYGLSKDFYFDLNKNPSLEAQIASISDDIAYIAHDFDDGIRSEILNLKILSKYSTLFDFIDFDYLFSLNHKVARNYFTRQVINYLVLNLIKETELKLNNPKIEKHVDIINASEFFDVFTCDMNPLSTGILLNTDKSFVIPPAESPDFLDNILDICIKNNISLILPLVTMELFKFSKHRELFEKNGIKVLVSDYETLEILNDKAKILTHLKNLSLPHPDFRIASSKDSL